MNTRTFLKAVGAFCLWPFVPKKILPPVVIREDIDEENVYTFIITEIDPENVKWWRIRTDTEEMNDIKMDKKSRIIMKWRAENKSPDKTLITKWENKPHTLLSYKRIDKDGNIYDPK